MQKYISLLLVLVSFKTIGQKEKEILVPYLIDGKYGFATEDGQLVISAKYQTAYPFYKNYELNYVIKDDKSLIINRKGKTILKGSSDYNNNLNSIVVYVSIPKEPETLAIRNYCLLDTCAQFSIAEVYNAGKIFDKMNGLYFVRKDEKVFLIDKDGKRKSENYDRIQHIDYGELEYCITEDHLNQNYGLLDECGKVLLNCVYNAINYKGKGLFSIRQGSIERDFKVKTKFYKANTINNINNEKYKIKRSNNKAGIANLSDQLVVDYSYDKLYPMNNDKFIFWKGKEVGIMDIKENRIYSYNTSIDYSEIQNRATFAAYIIYGRNMVFFNNKNKWVLIDLKGNKVGTDYDGLSIDYQFITGVMAGVYLGSKGGVIDQAGKYLVKPIFDRIYCLREDTSFVTKIGNKWNWINTNGKIIASDFDDFAYLLENFLFILKDGRWFYVNNKGMEYRTM